MKNINFFKYILIFLFCIFIFQNIYYYPKLPDIIASHYNAIGEPNGWMPKKNFFIIIISLFTSIIILLLIIPYIVNILPKSIVNLPNKHLWFNELIIKKIKIIIIDLFDIFNTGIFIFLIYTNQITIIANLKKTNLNMKYFFPAFIILMIFVILWIIMLYYKFSKKNYLIFVENNYFNNKKIDKAKLLIFLGIKKDNLAFYNLKLNKKEYDFDDFKEIFFKLK